MKKLQARTTNEALAYLQKYKIQNPIEIEFKHLKVPLIGKGAGKTKLEDMKPIEILDNIKLDHLDIGEFAVAGQWFSLKQYKGAKKKADKPSDNMLALLLDPDEAKKVGTAGYDMSKSWALIGGSGKGVATMNAAKLDEVIHDKFPSFDFRTQSLSGLITWFQNNMPNEIADGTILHLGLTSTQPGKESVVQIIHDASGHLYPVMIVDNEKTAGSAATTSGYIVCRFNNVSKLFELVGEPDTLKARNKINYKFYNGAPTIDLAHDLEQIDVSGWSDAQFAACMKSWMDNGTGMGVFHEANRVRLLEEVSSGTVYVRGTSVSKGNLNTTTSYIHIRELGGKA